MYELTRNSAPSRAPSALNRWPKTPAQTTTKLPFASEATEENSWPPNVVVLTRNSGPAGPCAQAAAVRTAETQHAPRIGLSIEGSRVRFISRYARGIRASTVFAKMVRPAELPLPAHALSTGLFRRSTFISLHQTGFRERTWLPISSIDVDLCTYLLYSGAGAAMPARTSGSAALPERCW